MTGPVPLLDAAQVVETERELPERNHAMAAVAEKLILSHVCGQLRDQHRALGGGREACVRHGACS